MKEFIIFFFAIFFSLWFATDLTVSLTRYLKDGKAYDNALLRVIEGILVSIFWALVYTL